METPLFFNHEKKNYFESLDVSERDCKKFMIDISEDGGNSISRALEYIWNAEQSTGMKICATFMLGRIASSGGGIGEMLAAIMSQRPREED